MSSSQWYSLLIEDNITMHTPEAANSRQFRPSRAELAWPDNDWDNTWRLARLRGLGSAVKTFLWKLLHNLLPTQERVSRISKPENSSPLCKLCHDQLVEDQLHAFFLCQGNSRPSRALINSITYLLPNLTTRQILLLDFVLDETQEFPVVWTVGNFLQLVWSSRMEKRQVRLYAIRAEMEARASLLRETRFAEHHEMIDKLLQTYFN